MKDIVIIGAGGHASVIIDIIESMKEFGQTINIKGLLDDNEKINEFMGYPILDKLENTLVYNNKNTEFIIAIGNNQIRKKISDEMKNLRYFTAIHPTATIGNNVLIKEGTIIMPRAVINANSMIGKHVIINTASVVEHDNIIDDYAHISPGAILSGGVTVGKATQIGANSTVIQYVNIGSYSIVGAGSTVIKNIDSNVIAVGSPAKVIKKLEIK